MSNKLGESAMHYANHGSSYLKHLNNCAGTTHPTLFKNDPAVVGQASIQSRIGQHILSEVKFIYQVGISCNLLYEGEEKVRTIPHHAPLIRNDHPLQTVRKVRQQVMSGISSEIVLTLVGTKLKSLGV
jgi:hypothetical protein